MKNIGIVAILAGVLVIILALAGVIGQGATRSVMVGAVILLVAGYFIYKRGQHPSP